MKVSSSKIERSKRLWDEDQGMPGLRVKDIDFDQMLIEIHNSKENKSRFAPLPKQLVEPLRRLFGNNFRFCVSNTSLTRMRKRGIL